jgi:hypothetical protein
MPNRREQITLTRVGLCPHLAVGRGDGFEVGATDWRDVRVGIWIRP